MPQYLGDILVVTKQELVPVFYPSYNALAKALKRYEDKNYGIKRAMKGGNNRQLLVVFDSLPKRTQDEIGDPRAAEHPLEPLYKIDSEAFSFYNDYQYPDGSYLKPDTVEKLIINASVLKSVISLQALRETERLNRGGSLRGILDTLYTDAHTFNAILLKKDNCQHTLNSNLRRFKDQLKRFKNDNYISLIKDAKGKSKRNALKIDEKVSELLNNLFAGRSHKPNATEVARQYDAFISGYLDVINEHTGEQYNSSDFKPISNSAITHFLRTYESKIGTYAKRSGDRQKLMQDIVPYESMEQPVFAGSMISIDDRQPPFWYEKGSRMWWYLGIDLASECIIAWAYGKTKEELILNFYRQLVRNYHDWNVQLPDALECESSLNSSFKDTFLKNGAMFQNVQIHPNSARSKRIEAYFKPLRYEIEKEEPGWIARPFARSEANQASSEKKIIRPYKELVAQGFDHIVQWNNMPNTQNKKIGRFDYFKDHQHPDLKPTNYKAFLRHLGYKTESSCNAGIMKLQNSEWLLGDENKIFSGEGLIRLLKQVEGKDINIYWLDDNNGNVLKAFLYDDEGRYICQALPKPKGARAPIEATDSHRNARDIISRYRNTVTSYMKLQKNAIDKVTVIDRRKKTISDSFSIAGMNAFEERTTPAPTLEDTPSEINYSPQTHQPESLDNAFGL